MTPKERRIIRPHSRSQPSDRRHARSRVVPSRPLWLGIVVAAVLIVAETILVRLLASVAPHNTYGAVYLLGVLVISLGWDIVLALLTTLVSAAVYLQIHLDADSGWLPASPTHLIPLAIFLPIGLLTNALAGRARVRATEARLAADQVSELAQRQAALRRVATLVAQGVSPSEVFTAVADEVANALRVENCMLVR
jgi:K+-sensing histidine kinase KdpD